MTINEEQNLRFLKVFVDNKVGRFSSMQFPNIIMDGLGGGADTIVKNMIRDGFITDLQPLSEYEFNQTGMIRYELLMSKKRSEWRNNCAFWVIFVCTIIAAGDVVCNKVTQYQTKNAVQSKSDTQTLQLKTNPSRIAVPETTKVRH